MGLTQKLGGDKSKTIVAVTGAGGYLGAVVVEELVKRGYKVRGTVRNKSSASAKMFDQWDSVELFSADLLKDGSFDKCFDGASYVMHVASPFQLSVKDPQKDLVDPALKGTQNVMRS